MERITKILLAILLLGCLASMPYGYFQMVRFVGAAGFAWFAYLAYERGHKSLLIAWVALAVLFQPIAKIALGRQVWNVVDVIVAVVLIVSIFVPRLPSKE